MLKRNFFFILIILLLFVGTGFAQESTKTGVGVAIIDLQKLFEVNTANGFGSNAAITVPIIISPSFRLEPEVGFSSAKQEATISGTTLEASVTMWNIGVGIFPQKIYEDFTLYYGGRVGYISQKMTDETGFDTDEETTSGFYIAPAIGGEHNFSDHFSIGAEAQFVYGSLTNKDEDRDPDYDVDLTLLNTRALIFFRFYF